MDVLIITQKLEVDGYGLVGLHFSVSPTNTFYKLFTYRNSKKLL